MNGEYFVKNFNCLLCVLTGTGLSLIAFVIMSSVGISGLSGLLISLGVCFFFAIWIFLQVVHITEMDSLYILPAIRFKDCEQFQRNWKFHKWVIMTSPYLIFVWVMKEVYYKYFYNRW